MNQLAFLAYSHAHNGGWKDWIAHRAVSAVRRLRHGERVQDLATESSFFHEYGFAPAAMQPLLVRQLVTTGMVAPMPLFYFDTTTDQHCVQDDEGMELPDWEAARKEAIKVLPDIARDELPNDGNRRDIITDVRDETGRIVFTAHLSFAARRVR